MHRMENFTIRCVCVCVCVISVGFFLNTNSLILCVDVIQTPQLKVVMCHWWWNSSESRFNMAVHAQLLWGQRCVLWWFWTRTWCRKYYRYCGLLSVVFLTSTVKASFRKPADIQTSTKIQDVISSFCSARLWKPVTGGEVYVILGLPMLRKWLQALF